jgi:Family of unknown function (DUF5684)
MEGTIMNGVSSVLLAQGQFPQAGGGSGIGGVIFLLVEIALIVLIVAGFWKTFEKAGKPGWAAIVPFYNLFVLVQIARKPEWWFILLIIPCVNFVFFIIVGIEVAKYFGKEAGFGVGLGLLPFIFYPILGWGDAQYRA